MALTPDEKRLAIRWKYPTTGFMVDQNGFVVKWKHLTDPIPTFQQMELWYTEYVAYTTKISNRAVSAAQTLAQYKDIIKTLSQSLAECKNLFATDPDAGAKTLFLATNIAVALAANVKLDLGDYVD